VRGGQLKIRRGTPTHSIQIHHRHRVFGAKTVSKLLEKVRTSPKTDSIKARKHRPEQSSRLQHSDSFQDSTQRSPQPVEGAGTEDTARSTDQLVPDQACLSQTNTQSSEGRSTVPTGQIRSDQVRKVEGAVRQMQGEKGSRVRQRTARSPSSSI
jgi:hypothetical protein